MGYIKGGLYRKVVFDLGPIVLRGANNGIFGDVSLHESNSIK